MNTANPTPLRLGAKGTLNGWSVRVAGRVVMSMELDGETYTWNEFNLIDTSGNGATLVFEETDDGPEWKLFRAITPDRPLTVSQAAAKRVGDTVDLDGAPIEITLVDQSRVAFIEGTPPEGVEIGDVANYFNADTGDRMLVVSWTGGEIEYYEGLDMPPEAVATAFGFRADQARPATSSFREEGQSFERETSGPSGLWHKAVLVLLSIAGLFSMRSCFSGWNFSPSITSSFSKRAAPASVLANGTQGTLGGKAWGVAAQSVTDIARVSGRHQRREYWLRGNNGERALLINALSGGAKEWHLLQPVPVPAGLNPYDAAALRRGVPVKAGERTYPVSDLFQCKTLSIDATGDAAATLPAGSVEYGFVAGATAGSSQGTVVARWTEKQLQLYAGPAVTEAEVLAAFKPAAKP